MPTAPQPFRKWTGLLTPLMRKPGVWFSFELSRQVARNTALRFRTRPPLPGRWEFTSKQLLGGTRGELWVRYVGKAR